MITLIGNAIQSMDAFTYPTVPIEMEMRRGVEQYMIGKGVERCWMEDRKTIGLWSDGLTKRPIEEAIWISPRLVSRWIGYAGAKEKWSSDEVNRRWISASHALEGRIVFLVKLAAYPKSDLIESENVNRTSTKDLDSLRFMLTWNGRNLPLAKERKLDDRIFPSRAYPDKGAKVDLAEIRVAPIAALRGRSACEVDPVFWPNFCPLVDAFEPMFPTTAPKGLDGLFGDFHVRYFWVEAPVPASSAVLNTFEVRIFSPSKERVAVFDLRESKKK